MLAALGVSCFVIVAVIVCMVCKYPGWSGNRHCKVGSNLAVLTIRQIREATISPVVIELSYIILQFEIAIQN